MECCARSSMSIRYQLRAPQADEAASPLNRREVCSDFKREMWNVSP